MPIHPGNGVTIVYGEGSFGPPDYDSGWVNIDRKEEKELVHNVGGNVDNYVIDLMAKSGTHGICNIYVGLGQANKGFAYWKLTNESVYIFRDKKDDHAQQIRVRIWKY